MAVGDNDDTGLVNTSHGETSPTVSGTAYVEAATPKETTLSKEERSSAYIPLRDRDDQCLRHATVMSSTAQTATTTAGANASGDDDATAINTGPSVASPSSISLRDLYRYASLVDKILLAVGLSMMALNGALYPCMAILFGEAISSFQPLDMDKITNVSIAYFAIAVVLFVTDYVAHVCLETTAQKQMHALRIHVFRHVIHKEIAWFDGKPSSVSSSSSLAQGTSSVPALSISHLNATTTKIKDGMGIKLGEVLRCLAQFLTGYGIGFFKHWQVSIVMASVMPFMAISLSYIIKTLRTRTAFSQQKYAEAGAIAEETLRSIRTVSAFNGQQHAVNKYLLKATSAEQENIKLVRVLSVVLGIFFGTIWITYAVGLWFGASQVANKGETDPRTVFTAFYGILIGTISLAQLSPNIAAVVTAKAVAASLFSILQQPSTINSHAEQDGLVPLKECTGELEICHVDFAYPSRPDTQVLKNYCLKIQAGETVAFVGPSGGGKSTLISLLQRFYDPDAGEIKLDGRCLQQLQLKWLRRQIGVVSQEPVLFATSIYENIAASIRGGDDDDTGESNALERQRVRVENAARLANAHEFIMALPNGYETQVGEKGVALSGGQKQRIAIARALVREPRILILDEATSALDTESEAMIQAALDAILVGDTTTISERAGRPTTLIIAHRLSTIRKADRIVVVVDGEILEVGTHEELIKKENGAFQELVIKSQFAGGSLVPRNASLVWNDSLVADVTSSGRGSSLAMLMSGRTTRKSEFVAASSLSIQETDAPEQTDHPAEQPLMVVDTTEQQKHTKKKTSKPAQLATWPLMRRLMKHNRPERVHFVIGLLAAMLNGLSYPASAVLLSSIVATMVNKYGAYQVTHDQEVLNTLYDDVWHLCTVYIGGAVALVVITFAQSYAYKYMAEKLVTRLRDLHFQAMCRQEIAFFDEIPRNGGTGALASDLATMATQAAILAGDTPGRITQSVATFIAALLVSFLIGSWILSLIMCVVFPLLIVANLIRTKTLKGGSGHSHRNSNKEEGSDGSTDSADPTARANTLASEAVAHIRTVAAFGLEKQLVDEYRQLSLLPMKQTSRSAHINGVALGFSSFTTFAVYALVFWYGGHLVSTQRITFSELIRSLMAIMISATGIGQATAHLTEVDDAKHAARSIFALQDQVPLEHPSTGGDHPLDPTDPSVGGPLQENQNPASGGAIEFHGVTFAYPTRPNILVLKGFHLKIEPGHLVALCGPSGGGKSTVISLLERFYKPSQGCGCITLGGVDIQTLDVHWLRAQIGLIAQEPVLFAGSIHDNIAYGASSSSVVVTREQVQQAAEIANAHGFISQFPNGYDTQIGGSANQLSGGQKQRIAIARAILKNPAILLLDEATSALDADSEQLVQDALEQVIRVNKSRTTMTLVVAHRMRTIRNADQICVVMNGQIVEQGVHDELVQLTGSMYSKLVQNAQDERFSMAE